MRCPPLSELPSPPPGKTGWPWTEESQHLPEAMPGGGPWPTISIVTPSYNQGQFLEETIRSVLLQGYPNLEYVVIDGGSTDESVEIIHKYAPWLSGWVSEPDRGQTHALNKGFERTTGKILAWLNSDDIYLPESLGKVATGFREQSEAGALVGIGHKVNEGGEVVYTPRVPELSFEAFLNWDYSHFVQPSCFFSRRAWELSGPLREDLYFCMDLDLWFKMAQKTKFEKLEEELSLAKVHSQAKTTAERNKMYVETCLLVAQFGGEEIAREKLMSMAEELTAAREKLRAITGHPLYEVIGPVYRWVRDRFSQKRSV